MPKPTYDPAETRLITARVAIMRTDPELGEVLCSYAFEEGFDVVTPARSGRGRSIIFARRLTRQVSESL